MNQTPPADSAVLFPLTIARGTTRRVPMRLKKNGAKVDLTGYTALLQVREEAKAAAVLIELSTENGGILIDGEQGLIVLVFSDAITRSFSLAGEYDLIVTAPDGMVTRLIYGPITPLQTVSRKP